MIFTNVYEPWLNRRDELIEKELLKRNISVRRFDNFCLYNPKLVRLGLIWVCVDEGIGYVLKEFTRAIKLTM